MAGEEWEEGLSGTRESVCSDSLTYGDDYTLVLVHRFCLVESG